MKKLFSLISVLAVAGLGVGLLAACSEKEEEVPSDETTTTEPEHTHSYTSVVTTAATCTEDGLMTYTCSCGASYTEPIPATGHTWGAWSADVVSGEDQGTHTHVCSVCGASESEAHQWGSWTSVTDSEGSHYERVCSVCETVAVATGVSDIIDDLGDGEEFSIEVDNAADLSSALVDGATIVLAPELEEEAEPDDVPTLTLDESLSVEAEEGEEVEVTIVVSSDTALVASNDLYNESRTEEEKNGEDGSPLISVGSGATVNLVLEEGSSVSGSASSWGFVSGTGSAIAGEYGGLIGVKEGGNLIISGDGDVTQELAGAAVLYVAKGGSCTINGGNFSVERGINYTIINDGDLTINGGSVTTENNRSSLIKSGNDNREDHESLELGGETLTINGGTFIGGKHTISNCLTGTLTITGGYFDGCYGYKVSNTTITNEGEIIVTELIEDKSGNATISGGVFGHEATEDDPALYQYIITIDAADTDQVTDNVVTITGGTFYPGYADDVNQNGVIFNINEHGEVLISESVLNTLSTAALTNVTVAEQPDENGLFAITAQVAE